MLNIKAPWLPEQIHICVSNQSCLSDSRLVKTELPQSSVKTDFAGASFVAVLANLTSGMFGRQPQAPLKKECIMKSRDKCKY